MRIGRAVRGQMPLFPFVPRKVAKPAQAQRWTTSTAATTTPTPEVKGKEKTGSATLGVNPRYSDEDFVILASLSLSDYALWGDPQLRRKWEWSIDEDGNDGCEFLFTT